MSIKEKFIFWGAVSGLSAVLFGSCYYLYKYMKDNSDNKRNQILPTVSKVTVDSIEPTKFSFNEKTYDGYKTKLKIEYVEDLGYDKEAEIILVRDDKYLYIVEKN